MQIVDSPIRFFATMSLVVAWTFATILPVGAEVRICKNVHIGEHDVSGQTFSKKRRRKYVIYQGKPRRPGCRWRRN